MRKSRMVGLTQATDYKGNEVPCSSLEELKDVKTGRDTKEGYKYDGCRKRGVIVVELKVLVNVFFGHCVFC